MKFGQNRNYSQRPVFESTGRIHALYPAYSVAIAANDGDSLESGAGEMDVGQTPYFQRLQHMLQ